MVNSEFDNAVSSILSYEKEEVFCNLSDFEFENVVANKIHDQACNSYNIFMKELYYHASETLYIKQQIMRDWADQYDGRLEFRVLDSVKTKIHIVRPADRQY